MPGAEWFTGAELNYAEHVLRGGADEDVAILSASEESTATRNDMGGASRTGRADRRRPSAGRRRPGRPCRWLPPERPGGRRLAAGVRVDRGGAGRVAHRTSGPAVSSTGSAARAEGPHRRGRIPLRRPSVRPHVDGRRTPRGLPTSEHTVVLPYLDADAGVAGTLSFDEFTDESAQPAFERLAFDHPLWVLWSSGTTGTAQGHHARARRGAARAAQALAPAHRCTAG